MAAIEAIYLKLTMLEVCAVHRALGKMAGINYPSEAEAEAGGMVYSALIAHIAEEE